MEVVVIQATKEMVIKFRSFEVIDSIDSRRNNQHGHIFRNLETLRGCNGEGTVRGQSYVSARLKLKRNHVHVAEHL